MHNPNIITEVSSASSIRSKFELLTKSNNPMKCWRNFVINKNNSLDRQISRSENASRSNSVLNDKVKASCKELKRIKSSPSKTESSHILKSEILQEGSIVAQAKVGECCQLRTESDVVTLSRRLSIMPSISCEIPEEPSSKDETPYALERKTDCSDCKITSTTIRRIKIQEHVCNHEIIVDHGSLSEDDSVSSESDEVFKEESYFASIVSLKSGRVTSMLPNDESLIGLDYLERTPFQNLKEVWDENEDYPLVTQTINFNKPCPKKPSKADENLYEEIENDDDVKCSMNSIDCQVTQMTKRVGKDEKIQISKTQDDQLEKTILARRIPSAVHPKELRNSELDSIDSDSSYISSSESERIISRSGSTDHFQNYEKAIKKPKDDPIDMISKDCSSDVVRAPCRSISISISLVTSRNDKPSENGIATSKQPNNNSDILRIPKCCKSEHPGKLDTTNRERSGDIPPLPSPRSIKTAESTGTTGIIDDSFEFLSFYD